MLIIFTLFGCDDKAYETNGVDSAIVMIGGTHANLGSYIIPEIKFTQIDENTPNAENSFLANNFKIIKMGGIIVDGNPTYFDNPSTNQTIENERWETVQQDVCRFVETVFNTVADDEEVDTLEAFNVAQNAFDGLEKNIEKRILICGSGLSTSGALNFMNSCYNELLTKTEDLTDEEIQFVVDGLKKEKEIPDLTGVMIHWYGLGVVGGEQQELSKVNIDNLKTIWNAILLDSGAKSVTFISVTQNKDTREFSNLPKVSLVNLRSDNSTTAEDFFVFKTQTLGFKPWTAEFLDGTEEVRNELLRPLVSVCQRNHILLVGTTSTGGKNGSGLKLSNDRADAVKNELVMLGVPPENIETIGLGINHHKYNKDEYINGVYYGESEAAKENRSVYIMLSDCDEADRFRTDYNNIYN